MILGWFLYFKIAFNAGSLTFSKLRVRFSYSGIFKFFTIFGNFGELPIAFSAKTNLLAIPPLFKGPEVLSSASDKAKLFAENFSKNSDLDNSGRYLFTCFPF